jgi:hydrogenase-4 membrane subunit HyfE
MTVLKYFIASIIGTGIALVMNLLFARKVGNQKCKSIINLLSFLVSIVICNFFVFSAQAKIYVSKTLDFAIRTTENKIKEFSPELLKLEYDASAITELTDEISNLKTEITEPVNSNEEKIITRIVLDSFLNIITGKTEIISNTISYFQKENGKISADSLLQGAKKIILEKASPYFFIFKILVIVLFAAYFIIYLCL